MTGRSAIADRRAAARAWIHAWWRGDGGVAGRLLDTALWPAEKTYRAATTARGFAYDRGWLAAAEAPIPVISVGNLSVGGSGKTPFAAWVAETLQSWGMRPAILLRGYGRDEVLLHRELNAGVPVVAHPKRIVAAEQAAAEGCEVAVLDDGFQHRGLARDLDVVLVAVESWGTDRRLLPRGPWREDVTALSRAGALVITYKTASAARVADVCRDLARRVPSLPLVVAHLEPSGLTALHSAATERKDLSALSGKEVLAVTSIADPRPFVAHLFGGGAQVELVGFPDHHEFSAAEAEDLLERTRGRPVVMTHKDAVKLRDLLSSGAAAYVLHQRVMIEEGAAELTALLRRTVGLVRT